jgi:adenylate cyclase
LRNPPRILAADDDPTNLEILRVRLTAQGYDVVTAVDGEEALSRALDSEPDMILLDVMMPKLDGVSVLKQVKQKMAHHFVPIVLLTAKADARDAINGLEAGCDDYLTKPFEQANLIARVRSLLRIKELHDTVELQATQLKQQTEELQKWNLLLEQRVAAQLGEIERMSRLQRFLSPHVARLIASSDGQDALLSSHRREITVVFADLRGFTALSENAEPEEVIAVLRDYHGEIGRIIDRYEGTLERFAGDGIMVLLNDPIPHADHTQRAVRMAIEMRDAVGKLTERWHSRGHRLGFGIGIALGYATLGEIGFERRREYAAVGTVTNLASRLCDEAKAGQILISQRAFSLVEPFVEAAPVGELKLKGFNRAVTAHEIIKWRTEQVQEGTAELPSNAIET